MKSNGRSGVLAKLVGVVATAPAIGCAGGLGSVLNPNFLAAAGLGDQAASAPGEAPAIVVGVENRTGREISARVSWRDGDGVVDATVYNAVGPGVKLAEALICPIEEMTLGDVSDLDATGAIVRLGNGGANDPILEVESFGVLLTEGVNFNCGDVITFAVVTSTATASGYQVVAFVERTGVAP